MFSEHVEDFCKSFPFCEASARIEAADSGIPPSRWPELDWLSNCRAREGHRQSSPVMY